MLGSKLLTYNMLQRIFSALVLIPFFIGAVIFSKLALQILIILIAIGMYNEWYNMTSNNILYLLSGIFIVALPITSLLLITETGPDYRYIFIMYIAIIWAVDSAAMIGGKMIEGPKLAPFISPNKTWSGLISGIIAASIVAQLLSLIPNFIFPYSGIQLLFFTIILSIFAQLSDLFVSIFKRKFHIKDSGAIIPGHGGILDRCDSLILTAPIMFYIGL